MIANETPDLILHNAHLVDAKHRTHARIGAVAINGGTIAAIGDDATIFRLRGNRTEVIDLGGSFLAPGLVDGHAHPVTGNDWHIGIDLSPARDIAGLRAILIAEAARLAPDAWIRGYGLDPIAFAGTRDIAVAIEDVAGGRPTFIMNFDYHGAVVSQAALALAGITGPRRFEGAASIVCDDSGRPTGLLLESEAIDLVRAVVPQRSFAERIASLRVLLARMAATGLTGAHVMDANGDSLACLEALEADGGLPLRLHVYPWVNPGATPADLDAVLAQQMRAGRHWRIQGAKFFIDGTIDGGTGWLHKPDSQGEGTGALWPDVAAYAAAVRFFAMRGIQTVTHAIGDAAVRCVLDTLAAVPVALRGPARHRIEHIETLPDEDIGRFAAAAVIPSMQPSHAVRFTRADQTDNWSIRLGQCRADRAWRCADIAATGAPLVLGSDWPIAPYDPREILVCARTRRLAGAKEASAVQPRQALTPLQSLAGLTLQAAYAVGEEAVAGALLPGMRADFTAFSVDPIAAPTDELAAAPIRLTMMDGRITHDAAQRSA
ncbi:amidohydrolase [Acidiphilium sp. AL]|uniref:amidohydrolase n=1 Tax=Acidiphilium sp. AL TaxID=2871704 RepID=UPI0021CAE57F|nr:amidohydrolase [Acidiphilium sp. AL]MCU4162177.1 amidohydrolase [Acidiphilium sp. AL]